MDGSGGAVVKIILSLIALVLCAAAVVVGFLMLTGGIHLF